MLSIFTVNKTFQIYLLCYSFAFLVFLTTNNVVTTAISLYERRMLLMGRKITVNKVLMFLAICSVPSLVVTVSPLEKFFCVQIVWFSHYRRALLNFFLFDHDPKNKVFSFNKVRLMQKD